MTEESRIALEKFISCCDELITCKFLIAENKIQKVLGALAETPPVYELVSECMEQFNRDREVAKAFLQEGKGSYVVIMPEEEFKIIALTFCVLADINNGKIEFSDFIRKFFGESSNPFKQFIETMVLPFRNLIAEAFGYPTLNFTDKQEQEPEQEKLLESSIQPEETVEETNNLLKFPRHRRVDNVESPAGLDKVCSISERVVAQILEELESYFKSDDHMEELKSICYALIMAANDRDFDILRGLALGLKYASKGVKCIKFLVRELLENIELFYNTLINE